jgi:hypothetical protein
MGGTNIYQPLDFVINTFLIDFNAKPKAPYMEDLSYDPYKPAV